MLQDIRNNAQGTIAKIIIGLLILGLSMFGMDAIIGGFSSEPEVATVNGEDITENEFTRTVQLERQRRLSQMENPDPSLLNEDSLRQSVLNNLIQQTVVAQGARGQGLVLSETDVDHLIRTMEPFQVNGQFSQERFTAGVRNLGMGVTQFREALRGDFIVGQVREGLIASAMVAPSTAETVLRLQSQTRSFQTLAVNAEVVSDDISIDDSAIEAFYEENGNRFQLPESVDVAYVTLSLDNLARSIEVTDAELREAYEARSEELGGQEQRRASHILIESGDGAQEKLDEVQKKLDDGTDFETLAEEYSADPASARQGGDLGYAGQGIYDSRFEEALFAMEKGEVSDPVETQFGYHIIKLTDIRQRDKPALETLESELRQQLAEEKAGRRFSELRTELADLAYSEPNLEAPAEELGLTIEKRQAVPRNGGQSPFDHPGLVRQLYSDDVLDGDFNTEVIDVNNTTAVVARVENYNEAEQRKLAEVKEEIRETLRGQRIREKLAQRGQELIERLREGTSREALANELGSDWEVHDELTRSGADVEPDVLNTAFRMPRPEGENASYAAVDGAQRVVLVALNAVGEGSAEGGEQQRQALSQFLSSQRGQREYLAYREALMDSAEIERP